MIRYTRQITPPWTASPWLAHVAAFAVYTLGTPVVLWAAPAIHARPVVLAKAPAVHMRPIAVAKPPVISIRAAAMVHAATITLSDVARVEGDAASMKRPGAIEIGPAPLPSLSRTIYAENVRMRLRQEHENPALLADGTDPSCRVTRGFQTLSTDTLIDTARKTVEGQVEAGEGRMVLEPATHPRDLVLPEGKLELSADVLGTAPNGATRRVIILASVDGKECGQSEVVVRIRRYVQVAIASAAIARGDALNADHIRYEERDRMTLPADVLTDADPLDGLQAVQSIGAGLPITKRMAAEPALIHRGDVVTLQARIGGIRVSASGVAAEDGRLGQVIRVRTGNGVQEARGAVLDEKTVEASL